MGKREDQEIKQLRAKVRDLELMITTQNKLIEILKSMPGCQGVKIKDDDSKTGVSGRNQKKSGSVVKNGAKGQPEERGKPSLAHHTNNEVVEKQSPGST